MVGSRRVQGVGSARTEGARRATGVSADGAAVGSGALAPGQRWSASRKRDVVLRLLRGESLEMVSREVGQVRAALLRRRRCGCDRVRVTAAVIRASRHCDRCKRGRRDESHYDRTSTLKIHVARPWLIPPSTPVQRVASTDSCGPGPERATRFEHSWVLRPASAFERWRAASRASKWRRLAASLNRAPQGRSCMRVPRQPQRATLIQCNYRINSLNVFFLWPI